MMSLIIESYFSILLSVLTGSIAIFMTGMYFILRSASSDKVANTHVDDVQFHADELVETDLDAIAGDDVIATQLDLARAYVETGKSQLAIKILNYVATQGDPTQQDEARNLLGLI